MSDSTHVMQRKGSSLGGDDPKRSISEDEFGLGRMVWGLAYTLVHDVTSYGYVLGLQGPWGSGKSSFANFLAEEIGKQAPNHRVIRFDPWLFGDKSALLSGFFGKLARSIDEIKGSFERPWSLDRWRLRDVGPRLARKVRQYGEYVSVLAIPVSALAAGDATGATALTAVGLKTAGAIAKLFGAKDKTLETLKTEITSELLRLKDQIPNLRFTVIIDDTDRLEPGEAVEILRLVRKVADFPLTTYVICFDRDALSRQVVTALQVADGHEYIEKFFQNIISIPPQEPFALRRYLRRLLEHSFAKEMSIERLDDAQFSYRKHILFDKWAGKFISTPRDVARLLDSIKLIWENIPDSSDFFDVVWLQLIKLKSPSLYSWLQEYLANVGAYRDGGRSGDTEHTRLAEVLFDIMKTLDWHQRHSQSGLGLFLPGVGSFVLDGQKRRLFDFQHDELSQFELHKRLGSPSHWRQYFAFEMPSYAITDAEVSSFKKALNDDTTTAERILLELAKRPHDNKNHFVLTLLDRLSIFPPGSFSSEEMSNLLYVFGKVMDVVVAEIDEFTLIGRNEVWHKATSLLAMNRADNLVSVVTNAPSVNWLAHVIREIAPKLAFSRYQPEPEGQWLSEAEFREALRILLVS